MPYTQPRTWVEVPGAVRAVLDAARKTASDGGLPVVRDFADVLGWRAGPINAMWGGPRPLTNTLIGAGLGALAGYGGGLAAEALLPPDTFRKGVPPKRFAILGGLLGAVPGLYQGYDNLTQNKGVLDLWPPEKASADVGLFVPVIPKDQFQRAVMADPMTPMNVRAGAAGLVEAASAVSGLPVVTPWDVTRIAIGAGSGLASGYLVGKVFGALAGLSEQKQQELQRAGAWAGALKAVVPQALGFR